ncbi:pentatricopeptide repeat-containing protein At5g16640, mitochondrial-like [Musa acuminata AAA Group]|uniref:pentatricopeptide repeat-containing protein At5g16640, mitochondrial-like n=1 Tax=Musa acuminata AAA Group TaxID=214697 RepID=UPI0031DEC414
MGPNRLANRYNLSERVQLIKLAQLNRTTSARPSLSALSPPPPRPSGLSTPLPRLRGHHPVSDVYRPPRPLLRASFLLPVISEGLARLGSVWFLLRVLLLALTTEPVSAGGHLRAPSDAKADVENCCVLSSPDLLPSSYPFKNSMNNCSLAVSGRSSTSIRKRLRLPRGIPGLPCFSTSEALDLPEESFDSVFYTLPSPRYPRFRSPLPCFWALPEDAPRLGCEGSSNRERWEFTRAWVRGRMQECAKAGNLTDSLNFLRLLVPSILDYNGLLYRYLRSGHVSVDALANLFAEMKRFGPCPNVWTFNILFNGLCALGYFEDAFYVLEEMWSHRFVPSFMSLRKLMKKSLDSGSLELSLQVLRLMLNLNYLPTLQDVSNLIINLIRSNKICQAYQAFSILLGKGFVPNVYACNSILFYLSKSYRSDMALSLFYCLRKKGFSPNIYSYTAVILGFSKQGLWNEAYCFLKLMRSEGCMPTVVTYTILIKNLCRDGKLKEAFGILETMDKEGCPPDLVTCNVLLHALCGHNAITEAHNFIQIMEEKGYLLDQFSWCALAGGLLRAGLVENSIDLLQKIILVGNQTVDVVTWNIYFHSLCCNNNVKKVLDMAESMTEKGFTPTTFTCNIILKGLCKGKNTDEALEFLDSFARGGNGPDLVSFNTILSAACKQGDSSMIRRVLTRMDVEGFNLDIVGMTCLMQYFSKAGRLSESFRLVKYMILHGHLPSTITCNVLLHSLCKKGFLAHAYRMFHEFKSMKTFPDTTSYNILIHASIRKADYSSMKCLLTDMYREGLLPDATTYGSLSYGLCRKGSISAAVCLEPWMLESGVMPNISYYNTILGAAFRMGRLWDVLLILVKMEIEGFEPDAISYKLFKRKMEKGGRKGFPKAMKILKILMNKRGTGLGL